ncbi:hypothetical protein K492DRAFT_238235 [Lichtheimia hyalospora FSU 10163]|nr:hypothetical protein K492DRAFT_238235 [Lichtheimia hyalospora FSU 10163]
MNIQREFNEPHRHEQSSYSPQDNPVQAPTRSHEGIHPRQERRSGSIVGDSQLGGYAMSRAIEKRWKGKESTLRASRPSIAPQRRESWMDKFEEAGKNAIRRSSTSTDALIDKLADKLNTWSPGTDVTNDKDESQQQQQQHARRESWSQRAYSFLFPSSPSSPLQQEHSSPQPAARPSLTRQAWSWLQPRKNSNATSQEDVEYLGSDVNYDDTQASFLVEKAKSNGAFFDDSTYRENFPSPPRSRSFSHSIRPSPYMKQPTRNYAQAARRSMDALNDDQQKQWFNADPESGRVAVPPLSVEHKMDDDQDTSTTQLLYDREEQQENDNEQLDKKTHHHNDTSPNKYHVVSSKQSPPPMKENIFDNDVENWKPHISGNTRE